MPSVNDDVAEKRRRRKSNKLAGNAEAGPSSEMNVGDGEGADSAGTSAQARLKQQLNSVDAAPMINVPFDVMNSNFEEWMKMATDNKINATNSWNFALIDYFHDMSLLRNNTDNSINFQRASCTLDGCVKIWTSRVDSVGTETGKLLSNLATEGRVDEDDEPSSDNPDSQNPSQPRKRKTNRPDSTLAKDPAQLRSKKLDLEFSVDPLFKKTCADFDEGGAQGLLMNHLSLGVGSDGGLRVVFDASDSMAKGELDEEEPEVIEEVDLSYLRREFLPDIDALEDKAISHSLASFSFSRDPFAYNDATFFRDDTHAQIEEDDTDAGPAVFGDDGAGMEIDNEPAPSEDFFVGDQGVGNDFDGGDTDERGDSTSINAEDDHAVDGGAVGRPATFVPFDPRRVPNERDLVLAMTDADASGGTLDYFDQNFLKNWAGPEHWKLRKIVRKAESTDAVTKEKPRREKKQAFKIDFLSPAEKPFKEISKELFAPVTRGAGINLPGTSTAKGSKRGRVKRSGDNEKKDNHCLPDDMHFSSRQLVTLFLKPKFSLKMRGRRAPVNEHGGEVDENFWAQAAADQAAGRNADDADESEESGAVPFNTQFFHDDYDDGPGFDDVFDGDGMGAPEADAGEEDLLAATQGQTRRIRPEFVNYAKRAKRVDVRKLKENIWKGLDIKVDPKDIDSVSMETDDLPATTPPETKVFGSVISGLQKSYPPEKMQEISTSFCFICLLHLANEQGLKLESNSISLDTFPEDSEALLAESRVGNLWDLKIYRDPNATPAA